MKNEKRTKINTQDGHNKNPRNIPLITLYVMIFKICALAYTCIYMYDMSPPWHAALKYIDFYLGSNHCNLHKLGRGLGRGCLPYMITKTRDQFVRGNLLQKKKIFIFIFKNIYI